MNVGRNKWSMCVTQRLAYCAVVLTCGCHKLAKAPWAHS